MIDIREKYNIPFHDILHEINKKYNKYLKPHDKGNFLILDFSPDHESVYSPVKYSTNLNLWLDLEERRNIVITIPSKKSNNFDFIKDYIYNNKMFYKYGFGYNSSGQFFYCHVPIIDEGESFIRAVDNIVAELMKLKILLERRRRRRTVTGRKDL